MLQGWQLKRLLSLTFIVWCFGKPSEVGGPKFIPIYDSLVIKARKNSPAYFAFEELNYKKVAEPQWLTFEDMKAIKIEPGIEQSNFFVVNFKNKVLIEEMIIQKNPELLHLKSSNDGVGRRSKSNELLNENIDTPWIDDLSPKGVARLREAQSRSDVLNQDWSEPDFSVRAKEVLEKSGVLSSGEDFGLKNKGIFISGTDFSGNSKTELPRPQVGAFNEEGRTSIGISGRRIIGPIEITGGLAVTNEHHIEIRRNEEGVLRELGRVDLSKGTYNIDVDEPAGSIVASLIDKNGKTLGEGSFRLNRIAMRTGNVWQGPRLRLEPRLDFSGVVTNFYNNKLNDGAPVQSKATFIKGVSESDIKKDGVVGMDNVSKGSSTVLRSAAPKFLQTTQIIVSGQEFKSYLFPESMIKALKEIVGQQRFITFDESTTIIWGRATLDGRPLSGIEISIESDPGIQPIYFNEWMIPDQKQKTTSQNGLYAFINPTIGFHSLLATRAESLFGYANVVVEEGSVAQGDIDSTIKLEPLPTKIYDAFSGNSESGVLTLQSLPDQLDIEGSSTLMLPQVGRFGMMQVRPRDSKYIGGHYFYNDKQDYIHIPLIRYDWLRAIKAAGKIDDSTSGAIIVGFVPDEDFEVYIAGYDEFKAQNIVYFDMQGRVLENRKGMGGGGFIIYNVPEDTHEIVVVGAKSEKVYSQVLPVDPNSLSVLSFR